MTDLKQLNIPIRDAQREKWHKHAEQSDEYNSLSQMVRTAVEKEISGRYEGNNLGKHDLTEVIDERVSSTLENIERGLRQIREDTDQITEIIDYQPHRFTEMEIYAAIPKGSENALRLPELMDRLGGYFDRPLTAIIVKEMVKEGEICKDKEGRYYREK